MIQDQYRLRVLRAVAALLQAVAAADGQALPPGELQRIIGDPPEGVAANLHRAYVQKYMADGGRQGRTPGLGKEPALEALAIELVQERYARYGTWAAVRNYYATIGRQFEAFVSMENQFSAPQHNTKEMK